MFGIVIFVFLFFLMLLVLSIPWKSYEESRYPPQAVIIQNPISGEDVLIEVTDLSTITSVTFHGKPIQFKVINN